MSAQVLDTNPFHQYFLNSTRRDCGAALNSVHSFPFTRDGIQFKFLRERGMYSRYSTTHHLSTTYDSPQSDGETDIRDCETDIREGQLTLVCEALKPLPSPARDPSQPPTRARGHDASPPLARRLKKRGGGSRPFPRPSSRRADHPTTHHLTSVPVASYEPALPGGGGSDG